MFAAAEERTLRYRDLAALREGDYFSDGKLHDCDGKEVPVIEPDDHDHGQGASKVQVKSSEHV
ncbi:hypothetical protein D3C78_1429240 [compost metagenome]